MQVAKYLHFFCLNLRMIKENWQPIHYAILIFAVFLLMVMAQYNMYVKSVQEIELKYDTDTLLIEQSHEFDDELMNDYNN